MRTLISPAGLSAHIRFRGASRDVAFARLGITPEPQESAVRSAIARFLEVDENALAGHVIERHSTGNLTLRPEAVFG